MFIVSFDNGKHYENPRPLKCYEQKLTREQRQLSRKVFRSNNWYKQKRKVERVHYRIACIKADEHQKATIEIVKSASAIGIETLKITNMLKNHNLAKVLSDSTLGDFLRNSNPKPQCLAYPL